VQDIALAIVVNDYQRTVFINGRPLNSYGDNELEELGIPVTQGFNSRSTEPTNRNS